MAVSEAQISYLRRAEVVLKSGDVNEVASIIYHVVSDSDISTGREELHEKWADIWDSIQEYAPRYLSPEMLDQISHSMAQIKPIDKSLWQVTLPEDQPVTILLGAGASKPPPSNIPVVTEFLRELWRRARKLDREDLNKLNKWCDENDITNIEDLLTAAQIANFSTKSSGVLALLGYFLYSRGEPVRTYRTVEGRVVRRSTVRPEPSDVSAVALLQDTLQVLFSLLAEPMIVAQPNDGHKAIAELISKYKNTTIITTNYDGCIDQAIKEIGIPCEYLIGQLDYSKNKGTAKLVKMHGSINWFYCESCQEMDRYDLGYIKEAYQKDKLSYPVMGICKHCGGLSRPMIVPPLSLKFLMFPSLAGVWDVVQIAFQEAKVILVVGYSFSEADTYITKMISRAMGADKNKRLIIVDTDRSLAENVTEKLVTHIDNFDRKRVIRAVESCDALLPKLCKSLLGEEKPAPSTKPKATTKRKKRTSS